MEVTEQEFDDAETRMGLLREAGHAVSARYDRRTSRVVVMLNTGVQLAFPAKLKEGLAGASPESLAEIEISPAGLGLHWPRLDADVYIPALLQGVFGSNSWMARELGAKTTWSPASVMLRLTYTQNGHPGGGGSDGSETRKRTAGTDCNFAAGT
jgi:hypothetical protein